MKLEELFEAFDTKVDYDVVKNTADSYILEAEVNGRTIRVSFTKSSGDTWDFEFKEKSGSKWTTAATGSGGELQVFAFVKDALVEFLELFHPETVEFTAFEEDGSTRGRLYEKFFKKYKHPNYEVEVWKGKARNDTYFTLKRK